MKKVLLVLVLSIVLIAFVAGIASAGLILPWEFAPDSNQVPGRTNSTYWFCNTLVVGTPTTIDDEQPGPNDLGLILGASALLPSEYYGAGFTITLGNDWSTWDSYIDPGPEEEEDGYWDSFSVTITQGTQYWDLDLENPIDDPTLSSNDQIVKFINGPWGGDSSGDLETYSEPLTTYALLASEIPDPTEQYYINLILDTATAGLNGTYPSWGEFTDVDVGPVPEPSIMLLLGIGLVGLAVFRKKFN